MSAEPSIQAREKQLREQINQLFTYIQQIKEQLSSIRVEGGVDHFERVADQLEAIFAATESATNDIMTGAEAVEAVGQSIREGTVTAQDAAAGIEDQVARIYEACSFQDITGQRISRIVRIMQHLESGIDELVDLMGVEEKPVSETAGQVREVRDGVPLDGPALSEEGVSQEDVDKLFD